jgi:hypothetical protein
MSVITITSIILDRGETKSPVKTKTLNLMYDSKKGNYYTIYISGIVSTGSNNFKEAVDYYNNL